MIRTINSRAPEHIENRYDYDFGICSTTGDWAQIDSREDAPWYGQWTNPCERVVLTYAEGDLKRVECGTDQELAQVLEEMAESEQWKGIDPWNVKLLDRFIEVGVKHLVHRGCLRRFGREHVIGYADGTRAPGSDTDEGATSPAPA